MEDDLYIDYAQRLTRKRIATEQELEIYCRISDQQYGIEVDGQIFILHREDEEDKLDQEEKDEAESENPYWDDDRGVLQDNYKLPDIVDHRSDQTPVKWQNDRGTCVCFASLAALEAILKRQQNLDTALSEQYAHWLFMKQEKKTQCDDGLRATLAARYLSMFGICEETHYPYTDLATIKKDCTSEPPDLAKKNAKYGVAEYALIHRPGVPGLLGPSIANTAYLETLLHHGHDIVLGTEVAWGKPDENGVLDVVLNKYKNALESRGGHAMLIVGYNRSVPLPYFIVKNSWGKEKGNQGYYYLSYDYIRTYAKYGYIILKMLTNMTSTP